MQTYRIITVHQAAHFDEAVGVYLAKIHGESKYPGLATAQVRLVQKDPIGGDERFDRDGLFPIGCGRGRCDDKGPDGKRKEGECSATLVAKLLGIDTEPSYRQLLAETLHCDTKSGVRATQLPEIIKLGNACFGRTGEEFILKWVMSVVAAIVEQSANGYAEAHGEKGASQFFEEHVRRDKFPNEKAVVYIRRQLERSVDFKDSVTELDFICRAMQRCGKSEDAEELVLFALSRLYEVQLRIQALVEDYRKVKASEHGRSEEFFAKALLGNSEMNRHDLHLKCILVHSDDPFVHRATSYLRYDVTAVRRSTGNVQIFANNKVQHLSLSTAGAMLRWLDAPKDQDGKIVPPKPKTESEEPDEVTFESLLAAGEVEVAPHWHYFRTAEQFFNGSSTHTDVPATKICSQAIVEVLKHAFHPRLIGIWKAERGIKRGGGEEQSRFVCAKSRRQERKQKKYGHAPQGTTALHELGAVMDKAVASNGEAKKS